MYGLTVFLDDGVQKTIKRVSEFKYPTKQEAERISRIGSWVGTKFYPPHRIRSITIEE